MLPHYDGRTPLTAEAMNEIAALLRRLNVLPNESGTEVWDLGSAGRHTRSVGTTVATSGSGSGSGASSIANIVETDVLCENGDLNVYRRVVAIELVNGALVRVAAPWIFDRKEGCCECAAECPCLILGDVAAYEYICLTVEDLEVPGSILSGQWLLRQAPPGEFGDDNYYWYEYRLCPGWTLDSFITYGFTFKLSRDELQSSTCGRGELLLSINPNQGIRIFEVCGDPPYTSKIDTYLSTSLQCFSPDGYGLGDGHIRLSVSLEFTNDSSSCGGSGSGSGSGSGLPCCEYPYFICLDVQSVDARITGIGGCSQFLGKFTLTRQPDGFSYLGPPITCGSRTVYYVAVCNDGIFLIGVFSPGESPPFTFSGASTSLDCDPLTASGTVEWQFSSSVLDYETGCCGYDNGVAGETIAGTFTLSEDYCIEDDGSGSGSGSGGEPPIESLCYAHGMCRFLIMEMFNGPHCLMNIWTPLLADDTGVFWNGELQSWCDMEPFTTVPVQLECNSDGTFTLHIGAGSAEEICIHGDFSPASLEEPFLLRFVGVPLLPQCGVGTVDIEIRPHSSCPPEGSGSGSGSGSEITFTECCDGYFLPEILNLLLVGSLPACLSGANIVLTFDGINSWEGAGGTCEGYPLIWNFSCTGGDTTPNSGSFRLTYKCNGVLSSDTTTTTNTECAPFEASGTIEVSSTMTLCFPYGDLRTLDWTVTE